MLPAGSIPRIRGIFALLSVLLLGLPAPSWPRDDRYARATLKGITTICVVADYLNLDAGPVDLKRDHFQTDAEGHLRKAGIRVVSFPEESEGAYLYLQVRTKRVPNGLYVYQIRLEFEQQVLLPRNQNISLMAPTWNVSDLGTVEAQRLEELREAVADMVDQFINAYLERDPMP